MYNKLKLTILSILGCLALQTYAIKLTNNTKETILYCCGNPADKNTSIQKYEIAPTQTVEITEQENYLQIYSKQKPTTLRGTYPLSNQTQDLTIITKPPLGMYQFVTASNLSDNQPKKIPHKGAVPLFGIPGLQTAQSPQITSEAKTQPQAATQHLQNNSKFERPQNNRRRKPSRKHLKNKSQMNSAYNTSLDRSNPEDIDQAISEEVITNSAQDVQTQPLITEQTDSVQNISDESTTPEQNIAEQPLKKDALQLKPIIAVETAKAIKAKSSYFTKKKIAAALGIGTAGALLAAYWWYSKAGFCICI